MSDYSDLIETLPGLIAWWGLDEMTGDFLDPIGGHDATPSGSLSRGHDPIIADGGKSIRIPSSGSVARAAPHAAWNLTTGPFWMMGWFIQQPGSGLALLMGWDTNNWFGLQGGKLNPKSFIQASGTTTIDDGQPHFFCYLKSDTTSGPGTVRVYLDGASTPEIEGAIGLGSQVDYSSQQFAIGGDNSGSYIAEGCTIDGVAIGKGALPTLDQIAAVYELGSGVVPPPPPPPPPPPISSNRPVMRMIPFAPTMYPDTIQIRRKVVAQVEGIDVSTYPGPLEAPIPADVWAQEIRRVDATSGQLTVHTVHMITTPVNRLLKPDDQIEYIDASGAPHTLTVVGESEPIGTGDVSFITECIEVD